MDHLYRVTLRLVVAFFLFHTSLAYATCWKWVYQAGPDAQLFDGPDEACNAYGVSVGATTSHVLLAPVESNAAHDGPDGYACKFVIDGAPGWYQSYSVSVAVKGLEDSSCPKDCSSSAGKGPDNNTIYRFYMWGVFGGSTDNLACMDGCGYKPVGFQVCATALGTGQRQCGADGLVGTGTPCSGGQGDDKPKETACKPPQIQGSVNGTPYCYVPDANDGGTTVKPPPKTSDTTKTNPDGTKSESTSTSQTECKGEWCTTKTTTNNPDGSNTETTRQESYGSYCSRNTQARECGGNGGPAGGGNGTSGNGSGGKSGNGAGGDGTCVETATNKCEGDKGGAAGGMDCKTPPTSNNEDPVLASIMLQTWSTRCALYADPEADASKLGGQLVSGQDPLADKLPGPDHATTQDVSTSFQPDAAVGGCWSDDAIALGKWGSVTIPWSKACSALQVAGALLMLLAAFISYRGVFRSIVG